MAVAAAVPLAAGLAAYAWWATGLRPFSAEAAWAVVGAGVLAFVAAALLPGRRSAAPSRPPLRALVVWATLLGALTAWEVAAWASSPRSEHPTLSSLANTALDSRAAQTAAFAAWVVGAFRLGRLR